MLRSSDIPSVWMRQCKANRPVILPFRENDSLPGDHTSNGPFGLLKKRKAKPSGRHTGPGIPNTPGQDTGRRRKTSPTRTAHTSRLKQHDPIPMCTGETLLQVPIEPFPACLYVSSTQGYERKTIERSKRKKAKNKFCARSRQGCTEEVQHRPLFKSAKSLYREQAADTSTNRCIFVIGGPCPLWQILRRTGKADLHNPCPMCTMTE